MGWKIKNHGINLVKYAKLPMENTLKSLLFNFSKRNLLYQSSFYLLKKEKKFMGRLRTPESL